MKARIAKACVQLLREHNMDEITVRDVAELCGISRQAFYYYFENIESVLMYSVEEKIDLLKQRCMEIENPREVLHVVVRIYRNQHELLKHLIQSRDHLRVKRYYYETLHNIVKTQLGWYYKKHNVDPGELDINSAFIAYGLGGLLYERCDDPDLDVDKLADEIYEYVLKPFGRASVMKEE